MGFFESPSFGITTNRNKGQTYEEPTGEYTNSSSILNMLVEQGSDAILELFRVMMNEAMKVERSGYLKAQTYERSEQREDYVNGYKARSIKTGMGKVKLQIPQTRESGFYPKSLEAGTRSEKALRHFAVLK